MSTSAPPSALSLTDKHKYRQQLSAEVDGLRRQVEELRQHVQQSGGQLPPDQQHFIAQLQGKRGQQPFSNHQRSNLLNSLSPLGPGQDMRQGMNQGNNNSGLSEEILMQRKQHELNEIVEQQRKLYSNLDNLDRQRSQILGDLDKTAALNLHLQQQQQNRNGNFPSQLRGGLSNNPFSSPMNQMGNFGGARDALQGFPFLNRGQVSSDIPPSLMDNDFGGVPAGFNKTSAAGAALGALRGRLQEMEGNEASNKRRRYGLPDPQKPNLGGLSAKNFHGQRISSSFLPSEIMVQPKNNADSLSVLSSSHQLLMNQREANMQRDMLFYQGINNGRNPMMGLNRPQPQHDGKLPETKRKLTKDFIPEIATVVLGKGNIPKTNIGNLKLKGIVMDNLVEYANGERRKKIAVISRIINHVVSNNYKTTGFVKFEDDCWWEMTERDARVKITALFRDCLHDQYRSSSSSKVKRRQQLRKSRSLAAAKEDEKAKQNNEEDKPEGDEKKDDNELNKRKNDSI